MLAPLCDNRTIEAELCSAGQVGHLPLRGRRLAQSLSWVRFAGKTVCFGAGMGALPIRSRQ